MVQVQPTAAMWWLPTEMWVEIFSHLDSVHLISVAVLVCKFWHALITDPRMVVWRTRAEKYFPEWISMIPTGRSIKWFCMAADHRLATCPRKTRYTGLGRYVFHDRPLLNTTMDYVGEFLNGEFHGSGVKRQYDSNDPAPLAVHWSSGHFQDGIQIGHARLRWNSGYPCYEGTVKNGQLHGKGLYKWDPSTSYQGDFQMDRMTGSGRYQSSRQLIIGQFQNDLPHGHVELEDFGKGTFSGTMEKGVPKGHGVYRFASGSHWDCMWNHDKVADGPATFYFHQLQMTWTGTYVNERRHGPGLLTWVDTGDCFEGMWKEGGRIGKGIFIDGQTGQRHEQHWNEPTHIHYSVVGAARWP